MLIFLNVRGLSSKRKQACLLDHLKAHGIHMIVATVIRLGNLQSFLQSLADYERIMSPCPFRGKGVLVVLFCKSLALQNRTVFVEPEGRLVVLDVAYSGNSFNLVFMFRIRELNTLDSSNT